MSRINSAKFLNSPCYVQSVKRNPSCNVGLFGALLRRGTLNVFPFYPLDRLVSSVLHYSFLLEIFGLKADVSKHKHSLSNSGDDVPM